ncbi:MAG: tRNA uridine-5-carboxymethylaminomethyl(34) synthesis enzyme MnmG [Clostridia bacterium]|nr:tRNA uridine-5-carboxymethylaminomethyl(34) synthesis enzyme MnmG [Clostridia bacterium]
MERYDATVIGAGHAGCEAALCLARMGFNTLLATMNLDAVAMMPCNPAIGGTAKGHLVREVDALGGEMGRAIDDVFIQSRMLNTGKGPAVYSLRAQADKKAYQSRMRRALDEQDRLTLRQAEVKDIIVENGRVKGVETMTGCMIESPVVIVCTGVYLDSSIIIGPCSWQGGPQGLMSSRNLGMSLRNLGFELRRFKTGTPARLDGRTIDFSKMIAQPGDEKITPFSFMTAGELKNRAMCYLTYTTEETHDIIRKNLHLAPMYSGKIHGTGARYCPSIEDKVVKFADKERHPIFIEPEGLYTVEWYAQGLSTSMPEDVQRMIYHSVPGLENAQLVRLAYAIEYDCIDPTRLKATLGCADIEGLYFAGQINGTSGYEEAAAQGILAGLNAGMWLKGGDEIILTRADAYIGVLADDLVTKGVDEPYRMMTSRAEYRLLLRQDNADLRLTETGFRAGLARCERYEKMLEKKANTQLAIDMIHSKRLAARLQMPQVRIEDLFVSVPGLENIPSDALEQAEISVKYEGYLKRQQSQIEQFRRAEDMKMPADMDYLSMDTLRIEARQKLARLRPASLGEASRIPGVSPGDIQVLMIALERHRRN